MSYLSEFFQRRKAKRLGLKLSNIHRFRKWSSLVIETPCRLGDIVIDLPASVVSKLEIGAHSYIRSNTELLCVSNIGRFCSIGRNVTLGLDPRNHPIDWVSTSPKVTENYDSGCTPLNIGHDVWIAHHAVVMAGITIGHGAVIACNAVVTKNVEPYQIVAGNPAKPIRYRFSTNHIEQLLASEWWEYDVAELLNMDFENVEHFLEQCKLLKHKKEYLNVQLSDRRVMTK